jgi:hypothetical protein
MASTTSLYALAAVASPLSSWDSSSMATPTSLGTLAAMASPTSSWYLGAMEPNVSTQRKVIKYRMIGEVNYSPLFLSRKN